MEGPAKRSNINALARLEDELRAVGQAAFRGRVPVAVWRSAGMAWADVVTNGDAKDARDTFVGVLREARQFPPLSRTTVRNLERKRRRKLMLFLWPLRGLPADVKMHVFNAAYGHVALARWCHAVICVCTTGKLHFGIEEIKRECPGVPMGIPLKKLHLALQPADGRVFSAEEARACVVDSVLLSTVALFCEPTEPFLLDRVSGDALGLLVAMCNNTQGTLNLVSDELLRTASSAAIVLQLDSARTSLETEIFRRAYNRFGIVIFE